MNIEKYFNEKEIVTEYEESDSEIETKPSKHITLQEPIFCILVAGDLESQVNDTNRISNELPV